MASMNLNISAIERCPDIPACMSAEEIRYATQADDLLNALTAYVINGWPSTRKEVQAEFQLPWPF